MGGPYPNETKPYNTIRNDKIQYDTIRYGTNMISNKDGRLFRMTSHISIERSFDKPPPQAVAINCLSWSMILLSHISLRPFALDWPAGDVQQFGDHVGRLVFDEFRPFEDGHVQKPHHGPPT